MHWEILSKLKGERSQVKDITDILLKNRGLTTKKEQEEFLNPADPLTINLKALNIDQSQTDKAFRRIQKAKENKELVYIYGDYDADGICSTAIIWETLHELGINVLPYIPDRFEDGYGANAKSIEKIKLQNPNVKLIITVDNGIVAYEGIKKANELGIDVIVIDHHVIGDKKLNSFATIHSTLTSGAGLAWFFCRELSKNFKLEIANSLELAALGVVADQLPLLGINRSIVKYGLLELNKTKRLGLKALYDESGISVSGILIRPITAYEIGFIIAPRLNAMGRLKHGIESLRLLCTKDRIKAGQIARNVASTNLERQKMVDNIMSTTLSDWKESKGYKNKVIVIASENYHEGVIGLAAGKLTEEFYRPSIVLSVNGDIAKASARSIAGFDIITAIRNSSDLILQGGGHTMAAGFSIQTINIEKFSLAINKYAENLLVTEVTEKQLKIDCEINFSSVDQELVSAVKQFEPIGMGNPAPTFASKNVEVVESKKVGQKGNHLKLKLRQEDKTFDAIWFNVPANIQSLNTNNLVSTAFNVEENVWNGNTSLQLKIKDIKLSV